ncbi:hypothetical protein L1987_43735 [Smallanthus sonchifolius]|uniref:Uncharacterized protein n=1 Tax=Smallanthus sonchifolius TaxID=185202 RepID=A0ACB9GN78_9ASTR|nr:hypothetical protein L1987_43735 [Smallanthus sonchifolius]
MGRWCLCLLASYVMNKLWDNLCVMAKVDDEYLIFLAIILFGWVGPGCLVSDLSGVSMVAGDGDEEDGVGCGGIGVG